MLTAEFDRRPFSVLGSDDPACDQPLDVLLGLIEAERMSGVRGVQVASVERGGVLGHQLSPLSDGAIFESCWSTGRHRSSWALACCAAAGR
ncbi:hypothetical protein, partial [Saccharopolyspora sp. 6V]|uniref:hypothetical protein n=1 Tax=Saccharopolyspora sp. 6V TaxID=2877239 RepID=UPI001CD70555